MGQKIVFKVEGHFKANLLKLANTLEHAVPAKKFSMNFFMLLDGSAIDSISEAIEFLSTDNFKINERSVYNTCGTVACAAGYGPFAGIPMQPDEKWLAYSYRVFIDQELENSYIAWEWIFGGRWEDYDNTSLGAAIRIHYLLEKQKIPVDCDKLVNHTSKSLKKFERKYMERSKQVVQSTQISFQNNN